MFDPRVNRVTLSKGLRLTGRRRGVRRWRLGRDEGRDGIGREEPFVLPALLQRRHGAPEGDYRSAVVFASLANMKTTAMKPFSARFRHLQ